MRRLFILVAMLLPLSAFQMKADDENAVKIIPLEMGQKTDLRL